MTATDTAARDGGRAAQPFVLDFPPALPVSTRRDEIEAAMRAHQVVIVCGETGSGKTTQLPKIALALGRGRRMPGQRGGLIGHTQPRRLAATSVARRIAEELKTPLGEVVGFKVRFQDRLQRGASVKLMTDGILLAETQGDPDLRAYDTLIIDEAHERSLNIDFLLGYLKQLLPRRPDLKLVITSATIDADRFARHFADASGQPAPVIQVSGRLYPVEVRWRPFEVSRDHDLSDAVAEAAMELWRGGAAGDILVFLPGEREIREAADTLHQHLQAGAQARAFGHVEVLPLYARLSQAEQDRVFSPSNGRRIVLATNVAETSLTVPGIRFVIDSGLARVKRYSFRNKVEQLQVEPISQAAAAQRAGRCGRVADGICIRLYDEEGFAARPRFTDPEILRSSLAGVVLRMMALGLPEIEAFPFLEPPRGKAIADGLALLHELGALDDEGGARRLTPIGRELAKLPLDPRIGRMILAARDRDCLAEVLVIAASLAVQDVRDRPQDAQQAADQKQRPFDDERSEFLGTLKLWRWLDGLRGGTHAMLPPPGHEADAPAPRGRPRGGMRRPLPQQPFVEAGTTPEPAAHKLSNRQFEQKLREHFISPRRVREWRDTHTQLHTVAAEHGWRLNGSAATYEQLHMALLAGLLGNVAVKDEQDDSWLGARGIRLRPHPGVHLAKKPGRWIMAAELVETTRLYARGIATIDPAWLPEVAGHLLKRQVLDPHWERKPAATIGFERGLLYGLVVYSGRRVDHAAIDPQDARERFIRHALIEGDWDASWPFLAHNRKLVAQLEELEHKRRRQDVLIDEALMEAVYDRLLPADVTGGASFDRWFRAAAREQPNLLHFTRAMLTRDDAPGAQAADFPKFIRLGGIDCAAAYLHDPGHARDGLTVTVPLEALNQVSDARCGWLVPGMLVAKVQALLKSLPGKPRARLAPLAASAEKLAAAMPFGEGALLEALARAATDAAGMPIRAADFRPEMLAEHHRMNLRIVDAQGRQVAMGRNLVALQAAHGAQARTAFQALAALRRPTPAPGRATADDASSAPPDPGASRTMGKGTAPAAAVPRTPVQGAAPAEGVRHVHWDFGTLPELMELKRGGHVLVGFPAVVDHGDHVTVEVYDEPQTAARHHRAGLRRLVALALREPLKALGKQLPDALKLAALYLPLGPADAIQRQVLDAAIDRVFLAEPLPQDAAAFERRLAEGRPRLALVAQEIARQALAILVEWQAAARRLKDAKALPKDMHDDIDAQLKRLVPPTFVADTAPAQLAHLPRYLKGVQVRIEKWRADAARDAQRLAELRPLEARWIKRHAALRGAVDPQLEAYRWLLEELRIHLFAQELRTPQPVSGKRLDKAWAALG